MLWLILAAFLAAQKADQQMQAVSEQLTDVANQREDLYKACNADLR